MGIQRQIYINRGQDGQVTFDPVVLEAKVGDQIFWTNNDKEAHWPGLPVEGTLSDEPKFFMPNQIAPGGTSSVFSPGRAPETFNYACSLHSDETGTINVT